MAESIALMPVFRGVLTGSRATTPGAIFSSGISFPFLILDLPSSGSPSGFTTLPKRSSEALILNNFPVVSALSPSRKFSPPPRRIIETLSSSRFKIKPKLPSSKEIISPMNASDSPEATTTPSVILSTLPTFLVLLSRSKDIRRFSKFSII